MTEREKIIRELDKLGCGDNEPAVADFILAREEKLLSDKFTYCAYCGKEFPIEDAGAKEQVLAHIRECPNHPIADYRAEIERLLANHKAVLERVRKPLEMFKQNLPESYGDHIVDGEITSISLNEIEMALSEIKGAMKG